MKKKKRTLFIRVDMDTCNKSTILSSSNKSKGSHIYFMIKSLKQNVIVGMWHKVVMLTTRKDSRHYLAQEKLANKWLKYSPYSLTQLRREVKANLHKKHRPKSIKETLIYNLQAIGCSILGHRILGALKIILNRFHEHFLELAFKYSKRTCMYIQCCEKDHIFFSLKVLRINTLYFINWDTSQGMKFDSPMHIYTYRFSL